MISNWGRSLLETLFIGKNLVEVKDLKKSYDLKEAVRGISFKIKDNEILGLLGPNGSGKTTTIGMLLGLLKP